MNNQTLQIGTTLQDGKYIIQDVLGKGGFGITYLAHQNSLNRKVAIKEFFMKELNDRQAGSTFVTIGTAGSRDTIMRYREKFAKEAACLARLQHPNIVHVIDVFQENGTIYYAMEYAEGGSLADKVKAMGRMPEPMATDYILQVASALDYIHSEQMNHLDIKPGNIMVGSNNSVILIDFGLSKHYDAASGKQTSTTPVGISEGYAPMEQYRLGGVGDFSPETDLYALGATFFKLLTGETPPSASDVFEHGLPIDQLKAVGASPVAIDVISRAMRPRKAERLHTAKEFINILKHNDTIEATILPDNNESTRIITPPQDSISQPSSRPVGQPMGQQPMGQQPMGQPMGQTQRREHINYRQKPTRKNMSVWKIILIIVGCIVGLFLFFGIIGAFSGDSESETGVSDITYLQGKWAGDIGDVLEDSVEYTSSLLAFEFSEPNTTLTILLESDVPTEDGTMSIGIAISCSCSYDVDSENVITLHDDGATPTVEVFKCEFDDQMKAVIQQNGITESDAKERVESNLKEDFNPDAFISNLGKFTIKNLDSSHLTIIDDSGAEISLLRQD